MSGFDGTWEQISAENLEAFMKAWGLNKVARKLVTKMSPKVIIKREGNVWKSEFKLNSLVNVKNECVEDVAFLDKPPFPGSKAMNVVCHSESETKTVFTSKEVDNESKVVITTRELVGDKMVMTFQTEGVTATRTFKKVSD